MKDAWGAAVDFIHTSLKETMTKIRHTLVALWKLVTLHRSTRSETTPEPSAFLYWQSDS